MGQARDLDMLTEAVENGTISKVEGITELAFRLNASEPDSFKQGWPLISAIEAADKHFQRHGLDPMDDLERTWVLSHFRYDRETEIDAILLIEQSSPYLVRVIPWPRGPEITVEKEHDDAISERRRPARVNWKAIGSVSPAVAEQFAKALAVAAQVAKEPQPVSAGR